MRALPASTASRVPARARRAVTRAAADGSSSSNSGPPRQPTITRRPSVFGTIIESDAPLPDPMAGGADPFEGEAWEWVGTLASVAVPILALSAVAVGAFAAKTYDSGADAVLVPASGEDRPAVIARLEEGGGGQDVVVAPPVE